MSRLSFFIKRLMRLDWQRFSKTFQKLKATTGKSAPVLLFDLLVCGVKYNAGYMDYLIARMDLLDSKQRKTVITRGISNNIVRRMNDKNYWHIFDDKQQFNQTFARWVKRQSMRFDKNTGLEELKDFLQDKESVFVKPIEGSSGVGVHKLSGEQIQNVEEVFSHLKDFGVSIVEETVIQHERLQALCPTSVNTVRVATLLGDYKEGIVYAFLRVGNGQVMDNVDCGGMAARINLEDGVITTPAADKQGNVFEKHPMTGTPFVGFTLPYFDEAKTMCLEAMRVVPQLRFVAWDVAITPDGPVFIEGNSFPSHAVPQFAAHYPDGIGILPEFEKFIDVYAK